MEAEVGLQYDSMGSAEKFKDQLLRMPLSQERLLNVILTTLGADLSDLGESALRLERAYGQLATGKDDLAISDILAGEIHAQLDHEMVWHSRQARVKIELITMAAEANRVASVEWDEDAKEKASSLAMSAQEILMQKVGKIEVPYDQDDLKSAIVNLILATCQAGYLLDKLTDESDSKSYLTLLLELSTVLDNVVAQAEKSYEVREYLAELLGSNVGVE